MANHNKISPSAWLLAKLRSEYTTIPYTKEIANEMQEGLSPLSMRLVFKIIQFIAKNRPQKFISLTTAEGRYLNVNDALPDKKKYVLIELAAGLSPRSIEKSKEGHIVIETDLPWLINFKERVLEKIFKKDDKPDNHYLLTINVLNREELETVGKLYHKLGKNKPLYIVHEGLMFYFTAEEKIQFRDNMKWFLSKYAPKKGHWVTTDLTPVPQREEKSSNAFKVIIKIIEKATKRSINFSTSHEETMQFLNEGGLHGEKLVNQNLENDLSILDKVDLPRDFVIDFNRRYSAYLIRPM